MLSFLSAATHVSIQPYRQGSHTPGRVRGAKSWDPNVTVVENNLESDFLNEIAFR